jgi:hypothetical protein
VALLAHPPAPALLKPPLKPPVSHRPPCVPPGPLRAQACMARAAGVKLSRRRREPRSCRSTRRALGTGRRPPHRCSVGRRSKRARAAMRTVRTPCSHRGLFLREGPWACPCGHGAGPWDGSLRSGGGGHPRAENWAPTCNCVCIDFNRRRSK